LDFGGIYLDSFWRYHDFQVFRFNCFEFTFSDVNLQSCVQQAFDYVSDVFVMLGFGARINEYIVEVCCTIFIEYVL
jgi:hypothetical protein